ncbi:2-oxo acid dehydrogenase subunit E2 [Buchnera aphidicola]|uniref:2-oxo acid dehydrogenase subunit E2 n=1 Tax=Buchnera aphidicola TaxID=9 RepID=UPI0034648DDB
MPDIGVDALEVTEILVRIGETVNIEQSLITVEGDKSSIEVPSSHAGIVKNILVKIGDKVKTSSILMVLENFNISSKSHNLNIDQLQERSKTVYCDKIFNPHHDQNKNAIHATPMIRRLSRKLNIPLNQVVSTGRKNRILKKDLELYIQNNTISSEKYKIQNNTLMSSNNTKKHISKEIDISKNQLIVGFNLHKNYTNIPHVTQFDEANITILENFRQKYNKENQDKSNHITILVFIIKVLAHALEKFPLFNSSLSTDKKKIILKNYINIGIAIDVNNDLFVPVLKNINKKNIIDISSDLLSLSKKAQAGILKKEDITGSCFTISNLGGIGGHWFSPIINAPEVAILGVSRAIVKPIWNNKEFIPSLMLPLSLSYDHRIINGAYAARFISFINKVLSDMHFLFM